MTAGVHAHQNTTLDDIQEQPEDVDSLQHTSREELSNKSLSRSNTNVSRHIQHLRKKVLNPVVRKFLDEKFLKTIRGFDDKINRFDFEVSIPVDGYEKAQLKSARRVEQPTNYEDQAYLDDQVKKFLEWRGVEFTMPSHFRYLLQFLYTFYLP